MASGVFAIYLIACFLVSVTLNYRLLKRPATSRKRRKPSQVRWSSQSKPAIGGISFVTVFLLVILSTWILNIPNAWQRDVSSMLPPLGGVFLAAMLAFSVGLYDDLFHVRPRMKLLMQLGCTGLLLWSGLRITSFEMEWLNILLSVIWVVGLMNALNMLDNMDGIATTVSIFICLFLVMVSLGSFQALNQPSWIYAGMAAGLFGFLVYNWFPSRMYMGDGGSMLLGVLLAAGGMSFGWNVLPAPFEARHLLIPGLVFLMPIADTTVVTINRVLHGVSPSTGGRDHSTHNLSYLGLQDNMVAVVFSFLSMIGTTLALLLAYGDESRMLTFGSGAWMVIVILGFFGISRYNLARGKYSYKA